MKYLYCPKCKELRVKPWYSITDRCARCRRDVRVIEIPRTISTYAIYALAAAAFLAIYLNSRSANALLLYSAIGLVAAMMVLQFKELARGDKYAKAKIKVTQSDTETMKGKGWK